MPSSLSAGRIGRFTVSPGVRNHIVRFTEQCRLSGFDHDLTMVLMRTTVVLGSLCLAMAAVRHRQPLPDGWASSDLLLLDELPLKITLMLREPSTAITEIKERALAASTPAHHLYGHFLTSTEVEVMTAPAAQVNFTPR